MDWATSSNYYYCLWFTCRAYMDSSDMPAYYRSNSLPEIQVANDSVTRQFTIIRAITPFTIAQVLVSATVAIQTLKELY